MNNDTINPLPPGGNCGTYCLSFLKENGTYDLQPGDLARLQVGGERRLLMITAVNNLSGTHFSIEFLPIDRLLGRAAGLSDSLRIDRFGTAIQKLQRRGLLVRRQHQVRHARRAVLIRATGHRSARCSPTAWSSGTRR